jgi:CDP-diacylglycerol---glycerol-3-phosphate 3-phosphatidyltransferase
MMDRGDFKQQARAKVRPLVLGLDRMGLTPNAVSVIGLLISFLAAWIASRGDLFFGAIVLIVGSGFDMLDGDLARLQGKESKAGAFLDSNFDRLAESGLFAGLAWFYMTLAYNDMAALMCLLTLAGSLTTSYARARAEGLGTTCFGGWLQRPERMVLIILGMMLGQHILVFVLMVLTVATWATTVQRILSVMRNLDEADGA